METLIIAEINIAMEEKNPLSKLNEAYIYIYIYKAAVNKLINGIFLDHLLSPVSI